MKWHVKSLSISVSFVHTYIWGFEILKSELIISFVLTFGLNSCEIINEFNFDFSNYKIQILTICCIFDIVVHFEQVLTYKYFNTMQYSQFTSVFCTKYLFGMPFISFFLNSIFVVVKFLWNSNPNLDVRIWDDEFRMAFIPCMNTLKFCKICI